MTPEQRQSIVGALEAGNKIEAIRLCREATGLGLADAKAMVERPDFATLSTTTDDLSEGVMKEIAGELFAGNKIAAIKRFRTEVKPDSSLAEAKAEVERLEAALRLRQPERFSASANRKGCVAVLLAMVGSMAMLVMILCTWFLALN